MSIESHISALQLKHRSLEQQIESELSRPAVDDVRLAELKREKLRLKEAITRLRKDVEGNTIH